MTWDIMGKILENHGVYVFAIAVLGWAYWQERLETRNAAKEDKEENKLMITALVEVRDALRNFKDIIADKFSKR